MYNKTEREEREEQERKETAKAHLFKTWALSVIYQVGSPHENTQVFFYLRKNEKRI
jgi:hypothetical protein